MITKTFFIAKEIRAYTTKKLRDHGSGFTELVAFAHLKAAIRKGR
jgi:hypothetical protein